MTAGWYRECSLIPHTQDIDFGILVRDATASRIDAIKRRYEMFHALGSLEDSLELTFYLKTPNNYKAQADLFVIYSLNSSLDYSTIFDFHHYEIQRNFYPKIKRICTGALHNTLVWVPCNVEALLQVGVFEQNFANFFCVALGRVFERVATRSFDMEILVFGGAKFVSMAQIQ